MTACDHDKTELLLILYGEAAGPTLERLQRRLATCADCRAELELLQGSAELLADLPAVSAAELTLERLRRRLEPRHRWAWPIALVASLSLVALGSLQTWQTPARQEAGLQWIAEDRLASIDRELNQLDGELLRQPGAPTMDEHLDELRSSLTQLSNEVTGDTL